MNEVEKMYKNCNIKPKQKGYCDWDSNCPYPHHKCNDECPYWKYEDEVKYPPFTAEKQIELIKFLGSISYVEVVEIRFFENDWCISIVYPDETKCFDYVETGRCKVFELALAELLVELWQNLTEAEQNEIKRILE